MNIVEYDQLVEFLGIEPETKGEQLFFEMVWKYMDEKTKDKVKEIEL